MMRVVPSPFMTSPVPRVMAIHDLAGFGRAALTVVIPILSRMGVQVCPLPSAVYSTHGAFEGHTSLDLSEFMSSCLQHWTSLGIVFDAVYSGFLSNVEQINCLTAYLEHHTNSRQLVLIDPVLGDHGKLYGVTDPRMVVAMRTYIAMADVITPNLTEAALLLGASYNADIDAETLHAWCVRLADMGPDTVIMTSVPAAHTSSELAVLVYRHTGGQFWLQSHEKLPAAFPGTGDTFSSVLLGCLLQGESLPVAISQAMQFVADAIHVTLEHNTPVQEGILLERVLDMLPCR